MPESSEILKNLTMKIISGNFGFYDYLKVFGGVLCKFCANHGENMQNSAKLTKIPDNNKPYAFCGF